MRLVWREGGRVDGEQDCCLSVTCSLVSGVGAGGLGCRHTSRPLISGLSCCAEGDGWETNITDLFDKATQSPISIVFSPLFPSANLFLPLVVSLF